MTKQRRYRFTEAERKIIWRLCKRSPTGRWSGIVKARHAIAQSRGPRDKTPSRPTIRAFLDRWPTEPKKRVRKEFKPKYVEKFEQTQGYKEIIAYHEKKRISAAYRSSRVKLAREGWLYLDKRDPIGWTLQDFLKLRDNPQWFDHIRAEQFGKPPVIGFREISDLRSIMIALGHREWVDDFPTKGTKRRKGMKRQWWLRKNEVRAITEAIEDHSAKMLFIMACYTGSRISTYYKATFGQLNLEVAGNETWETFETKTQTPVTKELNSTLVKHLKHYIAFMKKAGRAGYNDRLFPRTSAFYTQQLRDAAKRAGLCETGVDPQTGKSADDLVHGYRIGWHMTRHTFASQLAQEGVPMEHIMDQGPWTDAATLLTYYAGMEREKLRASMNLLDLG